MRPPDAFLHARQDPALAVLEGFHVLKHALRFGAQVEAAISPDPSTILALAASLAPDLSSTLAALIRPVTPEEFAAAAPQPPPTPLLAVARRPQVDALAALADPSPRPAVFLDRPNHLGNVGAVVRVAAAAGAAAVLTSGDRDPWHPAALRGSAGLHFALPVVRVPALPPTDRPLVAVDPQGEPLPDVTIPPRPVLAFGGERHGLEQGLLSRAARRVAIPMRPGVSSLNLATAAAVILYTRLGKP